MQRFHVGRKGRVSRVAVNSAAQYASPKPGFPLLGQGGAAAGGLERFGGEPPALRAILLNGGGNP